MSKFIPFQLCSIEPITEADAIAHQNSKDYNVMGYGIYNFKCEKKVDAEGRDYYLASWRCASSCD